jgi:hypothetical protein
MMPFGGNEHDAKMAAICRDRQNQPGQLLYAMYERQG